MEQNCDKQTYALENNRLIQRIFLCLNLRSLTLHWSVYMHDVCVCKHFCFGEKHIPLVIATNARRESMLSVTVSEQVKCDPTIFFRIIFHANNLKVFFSLGKNTHFWRKHTRIYLIHSKHNAGCIKNKIERNTNERENEVDNQVNVIQLWTVQDWVSQREYFNGLEKKEKKNNLTAEIWRKETLWPPSIKRKKNYCKMIHSQLNYLCDQQWIIQLTMAVSVVSLRKHGYLFQFILRKKNGANNVILSQPNSLSMQIINLRRE